MAYNERSLDDYVPVDERITDFRKKYPEGILQPLDPREPFKIVQVQGFEKNGDVITQTFVVVVAAAYRKAEDADPGVGMAWEIFPGRTPYTRGSELQNAETSAWGRAIIAVGASDSKRGIASREEVRNRQAERDDGLPVCAVCFHAGTHPDHGRCQFTHDGQQCACLHYVPLPRNADGSLSRSRTSDELKQAAGVMTDAEQRAHNALAKPPPNTGKVERIKPDLPVVGPHDNPWNDPPLYVYDENKPAVDAAVDDRWTTDAPSWLVGVDPPEDQPGSILPAQRSQIMAVYTALGIKDREKRLVDINAVLGTTEKMPVGSTSDLSYQQAARLLENLHERHTGKTTRR